MNAMTIRTVGLILALAGWLATTGNAGAAYIEQFETDPSARGWLGNTVNDSGTTTSFSPTWTIIGGNPGGRYYAPANDPDNRLWAILTWPSSAGFWGDLTGLTLTTDFQISGGPVSTNGGSVEAWFFIQSTSSSFESKMTWNPNSDTSWTTHAVMLTEDNFYGYGNFADTLKDYILIGILFGEQKAADYSRSGVSGPATANTMLAIDNFGVRAVPEPATLALLGLGLAGLGAVRRKKLAA
jgi:hypothetical protein